MCAKNQHMVNGDAPPKMIHIITDHKCHAMSIMSMLGNPRPKRNVMFFEFFVDFFFGIKRTV